MSQESAPIIKLHESSMISNGFITSRGYPVKVAAGNIERQAYFFDEDDYYNWVPASFLIRTILDNPEMRFEGRNFLVGNQAIYTGNQGYFDSSDIITVLNLKYRMSNEIMKKGRYPVDEKSLNEIIAKTRYRHSGAKEIDLETISNSPWFKQEEHFGVFTIKPEDYDKQKSQVEASKLLWVALGMPFYQKGSIELLKERKFEIKIRLPLKSERSIETQGRVCTVRLEDQTINFDATTMKNLSLSSYIGLGVRPSDVEYFKGF